MDGEEWDGRKGSETVGKVRKSLGEKGGREGAEGKRRVRVRRERNGERR